MSAKRVIQAAVLFVFLAGLWFAVITLFPVQLSRMAFAPTHGFEPLPALTARSYADPALWVARPDRPGNPAQWQPPGAQRADRDTAPGEAAVFFVHSTTFLGRDHWNAPLDDIDSRRRADLLVAATASAFNDAGPVWVPHYRQAALGAFLTHGPARDQAIDLAYADIRAAFSAFLAALPADQPIILAGHSQGALYVARLLRDRVRATPLARRLVAAYVIGWPVSAQRGPPALGLPACAAPDSTGCLAGWMSFAEPARPDLLLSALPTVPFEGPGHGENGESFDGEALLCTNPLSGRPGTAPMPASANLGTLLPDGRDPDTERAGPLAPGIVPARCTARGLLLVGPPPTVGQFVLPGNAYHVYDIPLFWANLRADVTRRHHAWLRLHAPNNS
ncbi:MAG: DUF3089 domain-containing protein [Novosphingobium aromaticivorans]|nr:DUF3089 domain-containing protein [Novosphingobium aromaticivorans]